MIWAFQFNKDFKAMRKLFGKKDSCQSRLLKTNKISTLTTNKYKNIACLKPN